MSELIEDTAHIMDFNRPVRHSDEKPPAFTAEATLGRLTTWLRLMGFDTRYDSGTPSVGDASAIAPDRIYLTRTRNIYHQLEPDSGVIWIHSDRYEDQIEEVIRAAGIRKSDLRLFCRCIRCNEKLVAADRRDVQGLVPDYVWETAQRFRRCRRCERIYWSGTHTRRVRDRIDRLFGGDKT